MRDFQDLKAKSHLPPEATVPELPPPPPPSHSPSSFLLPRFFFGDASVDSSQILLDKLNCSDYLNSMLCDFSFYMTGPEKYFVCVTIFHAN